VVIFEASFGILGFIAIVVGFVKMKESPQKGWTIIGVTLFIIWIMSGFYNEGTVYFDNCSDASSQGYGAIYSGDPGYRSELDRDGDGVACEWN